mgnify:CR=1 FL=1
MLVLTFCKLEEAMSEIQNIAMGERIRIIRERIGWTQEFLAEKIDISSVHLSRIENGKVTPGVDILIRVSEEMHVSIDELLFGKCSLNRELFYIEEKIQKMDESEKKFIIHVFWMICQLLCEEIDGIHNKFI